MTEAVQGSTTVTQEPPRRSPMAALQALEIDTRLARHDGRDPRDLGRLQPPVGRPVPDAPQPVEPVGPERGRRDHGDGHGPDHRVAQHRPVGRVDCSASSACHGHGPGGVDPEDLRPRASTSRYTWIIALAFGLAAGAADRRSARASSSRTSACRRSSSRWAGSSSGAASPSSSPRARRSRRWTGPSSCWAAGPRGRSAGRCSWVVAGIAIVGDHLQPVGSRRRRRKYGFPVRPMWADVAARRPRLRRRSSAPSGSPTATRGPTASPSSTRRRTTSRSREGGLKIPTGHRQPGPDRDRRHRRDDVPRDPPPLRPLRLRDRRQPRRGRARAASTPGGRSWSRSCSWACSPRCRAPSCPPASTRRRSALGVQSELDVIAAAVIGGTSFAGGIGTIPGAVLGAVVMQSLRSGMVLLKVDSPVQDIVVGIVLVAAVGLDTSSAPARSPEDGA